ncbi:MAG: 2Fe-2S iron-sulfur cluster-binding protein [Chromatiales bacterium]|jgi:CDP-4-dehydro-6-deoxyglucose reductase
MMDKRGFKVTITNSGEQFVVAADETILKAALRQGIALPHGCGTGVCGACIYKIIEGSVNYPEGEPFSLFEDDRAAGKGLCCVGHPTSDLVIDLEYPDIEFEPWE